MSATNVVFASLGGPTVTSDEHRARFRRPIADYYAEVLGQAVDDDEFGRLDKIFHDAYRTGLTTCELAADARAAMAAWPGSQCLLSMWFHEELVPTVHTYGLTGHFTRVDGLRATVGGGHKAESLQLHLAELGVDGRLGGADRRLDRRRGRGARRGWPCRALHRRVHRPGAGCAPPVTRWPTPSPTRWPWPGRSVPQIGEDGQHPPVLLRRPAAGRAW